MVTSYRLVGYDRATEMPAASYPVPPRRLAVVKRVAGLRPAQAALLGDWPVADAAAREIGRLIGQEIDLSRMDYVLEPFALQDRQRARAASEPRGS